MKNEKSEPNANKFLALTWHAFSSLQDMKFEQDLNSNMVIAVKDSMFKNFTKKLNKLQKIYYANEIFSKAFTKTCKMCNVIIAYLSAKRINPTTKKVEYVNTYDNIKDTLSCELKLSYKEFEPKMKGTPKPKKEKPAQTKRHSK